jgi:hypothetical protein
MPVYYSTNTVDVRAYQHFGEEVGIYNIHIIQWTQNLLVTHLTVAYNNNNNNDDDDDDNNNNNNNNNDDDDDNNNNNNNLESITTIKPDICLQAAYKLLCTQLQLLPSLSVLLCLQAHPVDIC